MNTTYLQKNSTVQKADNTKAVSVLDSSSQSESLQRKADMVNNAAQRAEAPRPNNTGMPDNLKSGIESLSGFSMDDVRVHYNSSKPATVQALAYTQGTDIHVAPGQEKHLPHEAWHVAQQMAGRVSPTTNINGMPVNDNAALEHEADVMGAKAMQMKSDESKTAQRATIWNGVVQRVNPEDYYYHISQTGIDGKINPKIALENGMRSSRGDDLGPGFYMGDFDFLKYYYGLNLTKSDVYIYYIEKKLIDETMKENIVDFTQETAPKTTQETGLDNWFQIAMQLGFRYAFENKDTNNQRLLDLLAEENKDELKKLVDETDDEFEFRKATDLAIWLAEERNMDKFINCVGKIYPNNSKQITDFFTEARGKAIWKGYINNVEVDQWQITLPPNDIKNFFIKELLDIQRSNSAELRVCANLLADVLPKDCDNTSYIRFFKESETKILDICGTLLKFKRPTMKKIIEDYVNFFIRRKSYTYDYMGKETGVNPPIQIAIRNAVNYKEKVEGVEGGEKDVKLLDKIKSKMIYISKDFIEYTQHPQKSPKPKEYKLDLETLTGKLTSALADAKQKKEDEEKKNLKTVPARDK